MWAGFLLLLAASAPPDAGLQRILARVSEEADVFRASAPKILAQEKLVQRSLQRPRRFRPRLGAAALGPPPPRYRSREIISEYGFGSFKEAPGALHEFRQVISVDGRQVASREKARRTLVAGLQSDDDRLRKRMLEDFEKHGLVGAATDFGQVLLLFTRRRLEEYAFSRAGGGQIGADRAAILSFRQTGGSGSLLIFERRRAIHQPLEGQLWVREDDGMPLRVVLSSTRQDGERTIRDEARVDYVMTPLGYLAPASIVHRAMVGGDLLVENQFEYSAFHMFTTDTDIRFRGEVGPSPTKK
jgi:hypothetical protein